MFKIYLIFVLLFQPAHYALLSQQQEEVQKEYIEVTNVELNVRALRKGKPVSGLKKDDFIVLENGKKMRITSFMEIKRAIGEKSNLLKEELRGDKTKDKRYRGDYFR